MYKKDILEIFIDFCNQVKPTIKVDDSLEEKYKLLGVQQDKNYMSMHSIEKHIETKVKQIANSKDSNDIRILKKLKRAIVVKGIIEKKKNYCEYLDIVETISGLLGHDAKYIPNFNNSVWTEIIQLVKNYLVLSNAYCQLKKEMNKKDIDIAKSILFLNNLGCDVCIKNCDIIINNETKATHKIEQGIKNIGGEKFLKLLFDKILYVKEFERFLIIRQGNQPVKAKIEIEIPYGYLFNLGLRYIDTKGNNTKIQDELNRIIEIAKYLCLVLYPVQTYTIWEDIIHKSRTPLEYYNDLVVKGSLFEIPQCQAKYAYQFCQYIFEKEEVEFKKRMSYNISDYKKIVDYLFSNSKTQEINTFFQQKLIDDLRIDDNIVDIILKDLEQNSRDVNFDYSTPLDYTKITFWEKPLIRCKNGKYILLPKSIIAFSFYEAFVGSMRKAGDKKIDNKIGEHIENFIKEKLDTKGITYSYGKYKEMLNGKKENGEADIVIETSNSIVLFECKKKSLTRNAKSGINYSILLDFAGSILDSQTQCARTDAILRKNNNITLNNSLNNPKIEWNNRTIERVTFTLTDYGVSQDRVILSQILKELVNYRFSIDNDGIDATEFAKIQKKFNDMSNKQTELISYVTELNDKQPFFNTWFFNLHQLLFIIDQSNGNDDFYEKMKNSKFVTMGSFDFYQEYFMRNLLAL
jgi:hypothetical protein